MITLHAVLASRYHGRAATGLVHASDDGGETALCGRVRRDSLCDVAPKGATEPTCTRCVALLARRYDDGPERPSHARMRRMPRARAPAPTAPEYLTLPEVCAFCRSPIGTVRHWINSGRLPSYKPGRRVLVKRSDLDVFLEQSRQ